MSGFSLKYDTYTPKGKLNFIGIVHHYFDALTKDVMPQTKETYIQRYEDYVFPFVNTALPAEEYTEEQIESLLNLIRLQSGYTEKSIRTNLRHLVYDPCEMYFNDPANIDINHDTLWGSASHYRLPDGTDRNAAELSIRKSFTIEEEKKAAATLLKPEEKGEYVGLALMLLLGTRNNETCPLKFGDIREMNEYPGCYYVQIYETVRIDRNTLKAGGKTYNAPRRLPIMPVLLNFIQARKEYVLTKITFPCTDETGTVFNTINQLPIACRGENYTIRCKSADLTAAGRTFLRQDLKMNEQLAAGLSDYISQTKNTWEDLREKDVTTYLLRRNFATHLYCLGFSLTDSQYYMGHAMDQTPLQRADFANEEYLHYLYELLLKHPLNHQENKKQIPDITKESSVLVRVTNRELNDPISIKLASGMTLHVLEMPSSARPQTEVDITKQVADAYRETDFNGDQ